MPDGDLAVRVRDYARERDEADPKDAVSSAWLAREFGVDPRTIAAALRPYGIRPAEVERGVRGYMVADLAGLELRDGPGTPDAATSGGDGVPAGYETAGAPSAVDGPDPGDEPEADWFERTEVEGWGTADAASDWRMIPSTDSGEHLPSAIERLSAGAGHDMTPALRAAGLL